MKTNEPVPTMDLYDVNSPGKESTNSNSSTKSSKYQITSTPIGDKEIKHPELINAPQKTEEKHISEKKHMNSINQSEVLNERNERMIIPIKNSTSLNLPNYKDLNTISMKSLEDQLKRGKNITVVSNNNIGINSINNTLTMNCTTSNEKNKTIIPKGIYINTGFYIYILKLLIIYPFLDIGSCNSTKISLMEDGKSISVLKEKENILNKQKYRRNSISELKYECLAAKAEMMLNNKDKKFDKVNTLSSRNKSIEKSAGSTKMDFTSKLQNKVFPANEHPFMSNNPMLLMKKLNGGGINKNQTINGKQAFNKK